MSTIYVCEEMNLFLGDDDPTLGKHLVLNTVKLPVVQEKFVDHNPAGSMFGVKLGMGYEPLEMSFKFHGFDPDALSLFGLGQNGCKKFTGYGAVLDKQADTYVECKTIVQGRLGKVEHDEFERGNLQGTDYMISEIMHYELWFAGNEKFYWDFFNQTWRVDGNDQRQIIKNILRIA